MLEHGPTTCSSKSLGTISGQRGFTPAAVAIARGRHRGARPGGIRSFANVWRTNSTQSGKRPGRGARPRLEGDNRLHPLREHGARHLSCPCPPGGVRRWATSCHTGGYWHGAPRQVQNTANGPFVAAGACFYWLHTHTPDGVIRIESPEPMPFTLDQFFDIWQQPLTARQVDSTAAMGGWGASRGQSKRLATCRQDQRQTSRSNDTTPAVAAGRLPSCRRRRTSS